jgi:hypothetical protein
MFLWKETEPEVWKVHGPALLGARVKPVGPCSTSVAEVGSSTSTAVGALGREKPAFGSCPKGWTSPLE